MSNTGPEIGTQFGPYLLRRLLGSGGMGTVYEAQDTVMDRVVALKLISGTYAQDPDYRGRLQREARLAGRLQDPHVVPVHSAGEIDGQLYVDMRLINGTDLDTLLKQSGPLPPAKAVSMARQVASALDAAHAAGILHRDVKPGNILITADDFAYLCDFGIANAATEQKLTQAGDTLGTWTYMAPERFTGDETKVTPSADTYALACVLFEALTGTPPFTGDRATLVASHLTQPPPRASMQVGLPPELDDVISRGMAKRPEDRYPSSGEFARAAEAAVASLGSATASFTLPIVVPPTQAAPQAAPMQNAPTPATWTPPPTAATQYAPTTGPPAMPPTAATQYAPSTGPVGPSPGPPTGPLGPPPGPPTGPTGPAGPQTGTPWPPPQTPSKRGRWIAIAAAAALVVAVATGLAIWKLTGNKTPQTQTPDISKLDVGHYGTKPHPVSGQATKEEGAFLEGYRIAEAAASPYEIDPVLDHLYGFPIADPKVAASVVSGTGTPLTQPVLEKYDMISGYSVQGYSKRLPDFIRDKSGESLLILLTTFPNDDAAARAAAEMEQTDFNVNPENQRAPIPGYPKAKAHYRPNYASISATMASGDVVATVVTGSVSTPQLDFLVQRIKRVFDMQAPLIAKFIPASEVGITSLSRDPDNMLSRTFVAGDVPKISDSFGSMGPRAVIFCNDSQSRKGGLLNQAGVDRCSEGHDSQLLRAKDEAAAKALLPKLLEADKGDIDHDITAPDGVANSRCFEQKPQFWTDNPNVRFVCFLSFGRYTAAVWSNEEKDVRQRAAAQYSILVNAA